MPSRLVLLKTDSDIVNNEGNIEYVSTFARITVSADTEEVLELACKVIADYEPQWPDATIEGEKQND